MYPVATGQTTQGATALGFVVGILLTAIAYGTVPLILRRVVIAKEKRIKPIAVRSICYILNLIICVVAFGNTRATGAYLLWTSVFTELTIGRLRKESLLEEHKKAQKKKEIPLVGYNMNQPEVNNKALEKRESLNELKNIEILGDIQPQAPIDQGKEQLCEERGDTQKAQSQQAQKWIGMSELSSKPTTQGLTHSTTEHQDEKVSNSLREPKIKFCRKCGARLPEAETQCKNCGTVIRVMGAPIEENNKGVEPGEGFELLTNDEKEAVDTKPSMEKTEFFCRKCGTKLHNGEVLCPECGTDIKQEELLESPEKKEKLFFNETIPAVPNYDEQLLDKKVMPPTLRRAFLFLEDEEYERADEYFEKVLDQEPECFEAYLGKVMCQYKCDSIQGLLNGYPDIKSNKLLKRAVQFADKEKRKLLEEVFG